MEYLHNLLMKRFLLQPFMFIIACAYFMQVQNLLGHCSQHLDKGEMHQGPAVLGIAMVAMAEELGLEMAIRSLEHLLQYGEQNIRRAVPLALGLLCISNPKVINRFATLHFITLVLLLLLNSVEHIITSF
jgi:hypothetical protein